MNKLKAKQAHPLNALALRQRTGLTQTHFWSRIGVSQSNGSRYESRGRIPKPTATLMEIVYGAKATALQLVTQLRTAK